MSYYKRGGSLVSVRNLLLGLGGEVAPHGGGSGKVGQDVVDLSPWRGWQVSFAREVLGFDAVFLGAGLERGEGVPVTLFDLEIEDADFTWLQGGSTANK